MPTPAVAYWSQRLDVPAAVITASHNVWTDNGVKIFAPGKDIPSAWIGRSTAKKVNSGNLSAAAHVAGMAAYFLSVSEKPMTPQELSSTILRNARKDVVSGLSDETPNRLLNNNHNP